MFGAVVGSESDEAVSAEDAGSGLGMLPGTGETGGGATSSANDLGRAGLFWANDRSNGHCGIFLDGK